MTTVKVQNWGNSLGVRIPKEFAKKMGVASGSEVEVALANDGQLLLKPTHKMVFKLEELVEQITTTNCHTETDEGEIVGNEVW